MKIKPDPLVTKTVRLTEQNWEDLRQIAELLERDRSWVLRKLIAYASYSLEKREAGVPMGEISDDPNNPDTIKALDRLWLR